MKGKVWFVVPPVLAAILLLLLWKFVPWYSSFSISDLSPVWYYSIVILLAILLMVVIWYVLQIIPKRQAQALQTPPKKAVIDGQEIDEDGSLFSPQSAIKPTELFSIENEARKTLSQIIGGFIVIVSVILTGANLAVTQRETEKNRSLALEGQITDRFTKAIGQLDKNNSIGVRLGGIYALERVAKDSEKDRWMIIELLTGYIRENAPRKQESSKDDVPITTAPADIQAILTIIGRRPKIPGYEGRRLDLKNTDLRGVVLEGQGQTMADFRYVNFYNSDLRQARLLFVDFEGAFFNMATFTGADINKANFKYASWLKTDIRGTNFSQAGSFGYSDVLGYAVIDQSTHFSPEDEKLRRRNEETHQ